MKRLCTWVLSSTVYFLKHAACDWWGSMYYLWKVDSSEFFFFFFNNVITIFLNSTDRSTTHPTVWHLQKKITKRWKLWRYCTLALNLQNVHAQIMTDDRALATWNAVEMQWVQEVFNRGLKGVWSMIQEMYKLTEYEKKMNSNNKGKRNGSAVYLAERCSIFFKFLFSPSVLKLKICCDEKFSNQTCLMDRGVRMKAAETETVDWKAFTCLDLTTDYL